MTDLDDLRVTVSTARGMVEDTTAETLQDIGWCLINGREIDLRMQLYWGDAVRTAGRLSTTVEPWASIRQAILTEHERLMTADPDVYQVVDEWRRLPGNADVTWGKRTSMVVDVMHYRMDTRDTLGMPAMLSRLNRRV